MQTNSVNRLPVSIEENEAAHNSLFFQQFIARLFSLWPWLLASAILCTGAALVYLKLSFPEYHIHASVLVQDDKKSADLGAPGLLEDFGLTSKSSVDNEAEIFKSRTLMEAVVNKLQLHVRYYVNRNVKRTEIYASKPVHFRLLHLPADDSLLVPIQYSLTFDKANPANFTITAGDKNFPARFGDTVSLPEGKAVVTPAPGFAKWVAEEKLFIDVNSIDATTQQNMLSLSVDIPNKQVSVVYLTYTDVIPAKGEDIVNTLIQTYLQANVNDKNRIADSTTNFIEDRLRLVSHELTGIEKDIENFKTRNKLTDLSTQSNLLLQNTSEYGKQQTTQEVQLSVVKALEQYLADNQNNLRVVPSSLVMQDANFIALVERYNEMQLQRDRLLMSLTPQHPNVLTIDEQLKNLRAELMSSIVSVKKGIEVSVHELQKRTNGFEGQISKVPSKERVFLDFSRQQAIKQELYLFLLKKREETAISKSATIANARIIDAAKTETPPFKPKKGLIVLIGLVVGLALPFGITLVKDLLNTRVAHLDDVTRITQVPVLAEIGHNQQGKTIAVTATSRHRVAEQFRGLRTNLQYLLTGKNEKTILITSSMSGEGKSFLAINLCSTLSLAGKKVILLELDLRKPKITGNLQLKVAGFTNYIITEGNDWERWVQPSGVTDNFDVLPAGPLPPNPAELLMLPKVTLLFKELSARYDYVVIDSPPAGIVTDAEILSVHAHTTFYVVRHRHTFKQQINFIERFAQKKSLPRMHIIFNDYEIKKTAYGYHYSSGYDYGDYEQPARKAKKKRPAGKVKESNLS